MNLRPLLLLAAAGCAARAAPTRPPLAHRVLLLSIDGLRPDYVTEADAHGAKVPHLRRYLTEGAFASGVRGVLPTVTYASHTTLLTGVTPAVHGVLANTTFDPFDRNQGGWYWYAEDIHAPTLWDAVHAAGGTTASLHWPVSVGARVDWNVPQWWRTGAEDDQKAIRAFGTPGLLTDLEARLGPYPHGIDESVDADEARVKFSVALLRDKHPDLMTTYFAGLDHEEHATGPFSAQSLAVLERLDAALGTLESAAAAGHYVVVVVSDHGFAAVQHTLNLRAALRDEGLLTPDPKDPSKVKDWAATAWTAGGSAAVVLQDPRDAATLGRVDGLLRRLAADPVNGIERVLSGAEARAMGGFPDAAFVVALKPGFSMAKTLTGPVLGQESGGAHGFLPTMPEMRSALFIAGPDVPRGLALGEVHMEQIAPTVARLLGVPLPSAPEEPLLP